MAKVRFHHIIFTLLVTYFFALSLSLENSKRLDDIGPQHHGVHPEQDINELDSRSNYMKKFQAILDMTKLAERQLSKADYKILCQRAIGEVLSIEEQISQPDFKQKVTKQLDGLISEEEKQDIIDAYYTAVLQKSLDRLTMIKDQLIRQKEQDSPIEEKNLLQSTLDTFKSTAENQLGTLDLKALFQQSLNRLSSITGQLTKTKPDKASQKILDLFDSSKQQLVKGSEHAVERTLSTLTSAKTQIAQIDVAQLPSEVIDWISAHPYQTAFYVVKGIVYFYPPALVTPLLRAAGLGRLGPRAGSIAAKFQATFGGLVPARGIYAYLQSAAQGGYGVQPVNAVIKAGSVVAETLRLAKQQLKGGVRERIEEETGDKASEEKGEAIPKGEGLAKGKTRRNKADEL